MKTSSQTENLSRLRWQCRRGMLELDELLDGFLTRAYGGLSVKEKQTFEEILMLPDQLLLDYLLHQSKHSNKDVDNVIQQIRIHAIP